MTSQGPGKRGHKKDPRVVETLPWQCQSTEPNDAPFDHKKPVNGGLVDGNLSYIFLRQRTAQGLNR